MGNIVTIARLTQPDYRELAREDGVARIITIPYSHYNEFAKWVLEFSKTPFNEVSCTPGEHILPVLSLRIRKDGTSVSSSSYFQSIDSSKPVGQQEKEARKARATATPVMVTPSGNVLSDSWSIASSTGMAMPPADVVKIYDEELGPLCRNHAYYFLLKSSNLNVWNGLCLKGKGIFFKFLWYCGLRSHLTKLLNDVVKADNPTLVAACREKLVALFHRLDERVSSRKGKYLNGDELSMEDFCFAALAAPIINPPMYVKGAYREQFGLMESQDEEFRNDVAFFRSTVSGKYVLFIYETARN